MTSGHIPATSARVAHPSTSNILFIVLGPTSELWGRRRGVEIEGVCPHPLHTPIHLSKAAFAPPELCWNILHIQIIDLKPCPNGAFAPQELCWNIHHIQIIDLEPCPNGAFAPPEFCWNILYILIMVLDTCPNGGFAPQEVC